MEKTISVFQDNSPCLSSVSLEPLIEFLKEENCKNNNPDNSYNLAENLCSYPDRIMSHNDACSHFQYGSEIREIIHSALRQKKVETDFYAVAAPFSNNIIYSSDRYQNFFSSFSNVASQKIDFFQANMETSYQLILKRFYGLTLVHNNTFVQAVTDETCGVKKFIEYKLISDYMEVTLSGSLPELGITDLSKFFNEIRLNKLLQEALPLSLFSLKGIIIISARDVTDRESVSKIKNILLRMPYPGDIKSFENLQIEVRHLINIPEADVCITSLLRANNYQKNLSPANTNELSPELITFARSDSVLWLQLKELFKERTFFLITDYSELLLGQFPFLQCYADKGVRSLLLFPLNYAEELIGVFSVITNDAGAITSQHLHKIEPLIPLLVIALEKQSEKMDDEIDRVIKEQFTAVQSSVTWKFTEAASNYINKKSKGQDSEIEKIVFQDVYPLYGSIDVRNSSIERSTAIQKDLLEQLQLADTIIRKSKAEVYLFSLREISYRIEKYIGIASLVLFPGDELAIQTFLDEEITDLFNHLKKAVPAVKKDIDDYFFLLNANTNKISKRCAAFEKSITMINNELVKFINYEQAKVQEIYAHYFEYFVTDGVDFNIYIGQSITPGKPFDQFYLKNLKLWQLTMLVKAAQKIRSLHNKMPVELDTTQLILAHSKPLSISFRVAERKFDVDGAYNIHYEIIKKRIDKVKIMGTGERLTQPGKIAIVFIHDKEAREYTSYINYLQQEGLLDETVEYFDLEELPGVRGLKALRVSIKMTIVAEQSRVFLIKSLQKVS